MDPIQILTNALYEAASRGFADVAEQLIDMGADPNKHVVHSPMYMSTPLLGALRARSLTTVRMLVENGANIYIEHLIPAAADQDIFWVVHRAFMGAGEEECKAVAVI